MCTSANCSLHWPPRLLTGGTPVPHRQPTSLLGWALLQPTCAARDAVPPAGSSWRLPPTSTTLRATSRTLARRRWRASRSGWAWCTRAVRPTLSPSAATPSACTWLKHSRLQGAGLADRQVVGQTELCAWVGKCPCIACVSIPFPAMVMAVVPSPTVVIVCILSRARLTFPHPGRVSRAAAGHPHGQPLRVQPGRVAHPLFTGTLC